MLCNILFEVTRWDVGHDEVRKGTIGRNAMNGHHIRMQNSCGRFGLTNEASFRFRVVQQMRRQELQRDGTVQPRIFGLVDGTHAALAQFVEDPVMTDRLADQDGPILARP